MGSFGAAVTQEQYALLPMLNLQPATLKQPSLRLASRPRSIRGRRADRAERGAAPSSQEILTSFGRWCCIITRKRCRSACGGGEVGGAGRLHAWSGTMKSRARHRVDASSGERVDCHEP
eukprot:6204480-Pleurochrysis_carterae.AAC.3